MYHTFTPTGCTMFKWTVPSGIQTILFSLSLPFSFLSGRALSWLLVICSSIGSLLTAPKSSLPQWLYGVDYVCASCSAVIISHEWNGGPPCSCCGGLALTLGGLVLGPLCSIASGLASCGHHKSDIVAIGMSHCPDDLGALGWILVTGASLRSRTHQEGSETSVELTHRKKVVMERFLHLATLSFY